MSTFVDCLMEALAAPAIRARAPEEDLVVDTGRFRGLFMCGVRERAEVLRESVTGLAQWVKSGGLDEFLYDLADCLIEMGVVRDQGLLDRFLRGAVRERLGAASELSQTDALLLDLSCQAVRLGADEAPVRLFARRYARYLGLVRRGEPQAPPSEAVPELTPLGEAARRLPPELLLPFVMTLEGLCTYGSADPWRAPKEAYDLLHERGGAMWYREEAERQRHDPMGLWRRHRLRRWVRMGLCEEQQEVPQGVEFAVVLSLAGQRAFSESLQTQMTAVAGVCEELYNRSRHEILAELWPMRGTGPGPAPVRTEPGGVQSALEERGSGAVRLSPPVQAIPPEARAAVLERPAPQEMQQSRGEPEALDLEGLCQGALRDLQDNPRFSHLAISLTVAPGTRKGQLCLVQSRLVVRLLIGQMLGTAALAVAGLSAPRLELELSSSDSELTIWLHDNGPGIPISQRPLVFADPQGPGEVLPRYQLGAVQRVMHEHLRGRIEIVAPRLGGASFRLSIPRHSQRQAA